jgi:glycosyltransferase involved in cell wall biosynthesis
LTLKTLGNNTLGYAGKVLILVENLTVPFDRRVWLESLTLKEYGYKISVVCPKGEEYQKAHEVIEGVSIYRYPTPPPTKGYFSYVWEFVYCWLMTAWLTFVVFLREGFDIIHACNPPDTFFLIGRFYKLFGKKFVFDQHDLCPEVYEARFQTEGNLLHRGLLLLEKLTYRTADVVISTNESYRRMAETRGGIPSERVFVVRSAPSIDRFQPVDPLPHLKNGRSYLIAYLGVMAPQDGVDLLIKAADILVNRLNREDVSFVLMGAGDCFEELKHQARSLGLEDYCTFTGRIPDSQVQEYISTADVCASPDPKNALNDKSTMNKILEYMAIGKPIVAFDLAEARVSAGEGALYAKPNSVEDFARCIAALLDDEELRNTMGAKNRERLVNELAWDHTRLNLVRAYEFLAER